MNKKVSIKKLCVPFFITLLSLLFLFQFTATAKTSNAEFYNHEINMDNNNDESVFQLGHKLQTFPLSAKSNQVVDVLILVDESGSMAWSSKNNGYAQKNAIGYETTASYFMKQGLKQFADTIWNNAPSNPTQVYRIGVVGYNKQVNSESSSIAQSAGGMVESANSQDFMNFIENLESNFSENMPAAIDVVLNTPEAYINAPMPKFLDDSLPVVSRKYLIIIGDGSTTNSALLPPNLQPNIAAVNILNAYRKDSGKPSIDDVFCISFPGYNFSSDYVSNGRISKSSNPIEQGLIYLSTSFVSYENISLVQPANATKDFQTAFSGASEDMVSHTNYEHAYSESKSIEIFSEIARQIQDQSAQKTEWVLDIKLNSDFTIDGVPEVAFSDAPALRATLPYQIKSTNDGFIFSTSLPFDKSSQFTIDYAVRVSPNAIGGNQQLFSRSSLSFNNAGTIVSENINSPTIQIKSANNSGSVSSPSGANFGGNSNQNYQKPNEIPSNNKPKNTSPHSERLVPYLISNVSGVGTATTSATATGTHTISSLPKTMIQAETLQELCAEIILE